MIGIRRASLAAVFLGSMISVAGAWTINIDGPDVFGKKKAVAVEGSGTDALVVQCDSQDQLDIAYIFKIDKPSDIPKTDATLYVQTKGNAPAKLSATLVPWNDNYGGIVASGRTVEIVRVLRAIHDASGPIQIGGEANGHQLSTSVSSSRSTVAMQRLMEACNLSNIDAKAN